MKYCVLIIILICIISCSNQPKETTETLHQIDTKTEEANTKLNLVSELTNPHYDILADLLHGKLNGKIVYVDIWATWCRPCIAEIPYAKTLEQKFEGKEIAFISLCCGSTEGTWKNILKEYEVPGEHHLLNENQCVSLRDSFHLVSFPTYMIFDKKGNLLYGDAPRPSSNQAESILNELISKQ